MREGSWFARAGFFWPGARRIDPFIPACGTSSVDTVSVTRRLPTPSFESSSRRRAHLHPSLRRSEKIETAVEPKFQQHFVEAMAIPHKTAPSTNLSKVVTLPPIKEIVTLGDDGGTRRARRRG